MKNSLAEAGMISDPKSFAVGNRHLTQQQGRVLNVPVFLFDMVFVVYCMESITTGSNTLGWPSPYHYWSLVSNIYYEYNSTHNDK